MEELLTRGPHLRLPLPPRGAHLRAGPSTSTPGKILEAKGMQVMIDNNLDFDVALYPYELVTYGETGQVCQNWMQYLLIKRYLREMTDRPDPGGLLRPPAGPLPLAPRGAPRHHHQRPHGGHVRHPGAASTGSPPWACVNYGQMTAGGWMYIGPQGIVHGTYITLLNAGRLYLGIPAGPGPARPRSSSPRGSAACPAPSPRPPRSPGGVGVIAEVDAQPHPDAPQPGLGEPRLRRPARGRPRGC